MFQASEVRRLWHNQKIASPGSICELSFRLVNLIAAFCDKSVHPREVCERALDIDGDHRLWRQVLPPHFEYLTVPLGTPACTEGLAMVRHEYPNLLIAEAWNHWRTQRILTNKIIVKSSALHDERVLAALLVIQQMCMDLCITALNFTDDPRKFTLFCAFYK